jgi:hypothetical protein
MKFTPPIPSCSNENICFHVGDYSFGFNSQEKDKEMWGGSISFKYRVEDSRLGRFFSVDPLARSFPFNSSYAFAENRVIDGIELEGKEWTSTTTVHEDGSTTVHLHVTIRVENASSVVDQAQLQLILSASAAEIERVFTQYDKENDICYETSVEFIVLPEKERLCEDDFGIVLTDITPANGSSVSTTGEAKLGDTVSNIVMVAAGSHPPGKPGGPVTAISVGDVARTVAHELGHTAGLDHLYMGNIPDMRGFGNFDTPNTNEQGVPVDVRENYATCMAIIKAPSVNIQKNLITQTGHVNPNESGVLSNIMMQSIAQEDVGKAWNNSIKDIVKIDGYQNMKKVNIDVASPATVSQMEIINRTVTRQQ